MTYTVIYDGECNLCSNLVHVLEQLDRGQRFRYLPMQDHAALARWQITPQDCEMGMMLISDEDPEQRWQGSEAAEEIARLVPAGEVFIDVYRALPGLKHLGDRGYEQIRDHRYDWFGRRSQVYRSAYPSDTCSACRS